MDNGRKGGKGRQTELSLIHVERSIAGDYHLERTRRIFLQFPSEKQKVLLEEHPFQANLQRETNLYTIFEPFLPGNPKIIKPGKLRIIKTKKLTVECKIDAHLRCHEEHICEWDEKSSTHR